MPRYPGALLAACCAALLAACGGATGTAAPEWRPAPAFSGEPNLPHVEIPLPTPSAPTGGQDSGPSQPNRPGSSQPQGPSRSNDQDPSVVATRLTAPSGIAVLPDGTALVGERTTGRVLQVQPQAGQPVKTVRTITGLSTAGGGGLLDLTLSPTYSQDGLVFAYLTTATDNRVVAFTLKGAVTPVLTGIPRGSSGNAGRLMAGADGRLYVATGDAGNAAAAADPENLAGKVLRITDIGTPAPGNPSATSPVFTSGHHAVAGLCTSVEVPDPNQPQVPPATAPPLFEVETAGNGRGEINLLDAGDDYGTAGRAPLAQMPAAQRHPGGCAVLGSVLFVTSLDGTSLLSTRIDSSGGSRSLDKIETVLSKKYGRLLSVAAAQDGSLWLSTSNKDGNGKPVPDDERVIRIVPSAGASTSPV